MVKVDVVIPTNRECWPFLSEAIESVLNQVGLVTPIVHVINDGENVSDFLSVVEPYKQYVKIYNNHSAEGPYIITNKLFGRYLDPQSQFLAIQDSDDISLPDRFVTSLEKLGDCDLYSAVGQNFLDWRCESEEMRDKLKREPYIIPGAISPSSPLGRTVNGSTLMRKSLFQKVNGFANIYCVSDTEFSNRIRLAGAEVVDDAETVLLLRRLHGGNTTASEEWKQGSEKRKEASRYIIKCYQDAKKNPSGYNPRGYGCLHEYKSAQGLALLNPPRTTPVAAVMTVAGGCGCNGTKKEPNLFQKAINLTKATVSELTAIASGEEALTEDQVQERLRICESCPLRSKDDRWVCTHENCGCYLRVKATWRSQKCPWQTPEHPDGKWPSLTADST